MIVVSSCPADTSIGTAEYYKSLTFAVTGKRPRNVFKAQQSTAALTVFPNRIDSYSLSLDHVQLVAQEKVSISLETYEDFVEGTIKVGHFIGEIMALGTFHGVLDKDPQFSCVSWRRVFSSQNQCVFKKEADGKLGIYFVIDDEVVGLATVGGDTEDTEVGATDIVRGSCNWAWVFQTVFEECCEAHDCYHSLDAEDPEVEKLSAALATTFASIFPEEPVKAANGTAV